MAVVKTPAIISNNPIYIYIAVLRSTRHMPRNVYPIINLCVHSLNPNILVSVHVNDTSNLPCTRVCGEHVGKFLAFASLLCVQSNVENLVKAKLVNYLIKLRPGRSPELFLFLHTQ